MAMESQFKDRLRQAWHEAWDNGNVDALDDLLADDYERTSHGSGKRLSAAEFKEEILATRRAFPDLVTSVDNLLQEGDQVAIFWTSTGTHRDELLGVPATNRRVTTHGSNLCTVTNGKLSRERVTWDPRHLLTALGISTVRHD